MGLNHIALTEEGGKGGLNHIALTRSCWLSSLGHCDLAVTQALQSTKCMRSELGAKHRRQGFRTSFGELPLSHRTLCMAAFPKLDIHVPTDTQRHAASVASTRSGVLCT